jgi:hypothetical protein
MKILKKISRNVLMLEFEVFGWATSWFCVENVNINDMILLIRGSVQFNIQSDFKVQL